MTETYRPRKRITEIKEKKEIKPNELRADNRSTTQFRPIYMKTSTISQAKGSAYIELNKNKIICGIYGPRQKKKLQFSNKGKLLCTFKYAPFALEERRKRGQDPDEKSNSHILNEALSISIQLDKYPKSVIEAYITVIEHDTGMLCASLMCASLALCDAGIELYDIITSSHVGSLRGVLLLDPSKEEESDLSYESTVILSYMPNLQQITYVSQNGTSDDKTVNEMLDLCISGCTKVGSLMRECLISSAKTKINKK